MTDLFSFYLQNFRIFSLTITLRFQSLHLFSHHFCNSFHISFIKLHFINFLFSYNKDECRLSMFYLSITRSWDIWDRFYLFAGGLFLLPTAWSTVSLALVLRILEVALNEVPSEAALPHCSALKIDV